MNHDDILGLVELGFKLFTDVNSATHHHHVNPYFNSDNFSVARDLAQVGQKLYKISSNNNSRLALVSQWRDGDGDPMDIAYHRESGTVRMGFLSSEGYYRHMGAGNVYSNSIAAMVSGYWSGNTFTVFQLISNDGYTMNIAMLQGNEISYHSAVRVSEWTAGTI